MRARPLSFLSFSFSFSLLLFGCFESPDPAEPLPPNVSSQQAPLRDDGPTPLPPSCSDQCYWASQTCQTDCGASAEQCQADIVICHDSCRRGVGPALPC